MCTVAVVVATDGRREQNFTHCLKTDRRKQMEGEQKGPTEMERCFGEESVKFSQMVRDELDTKVLILLSC